MASFDSMYGILPRPSIKMSVAGAIKHSNKLKHFYIYYYCYQFCVFFPSFVSKTIDNDYIAVFQCISSFLYFTIIFKNCLGDFIRKSKFFVRTLYDSIKKCVGLAKKGSGTNSSYLYYAQRYLHFNIAVR